MARFADDSRRRLDKAHPLIVEVMERVIEVVDVTIGETWRSYETHQEYLAHDPPRTKVSYRETRHSRRPSEAVHVLPYPELWQASTERWYYVGGLVVGVAHMALPDGVVWRWGGDWDGDDIFSDQGFDDLAHHELRWTED